MLERLLDPAVDRQDQRLPPCRGIGQITVERALHASNAVAVDVGKADDVGGKRRLWTEPVGLALDGKPRLADRVHSLDQRRRGAATQVEEGLPGLKKREILLFAIFGHELGE